MNKKTSRLRRAKKGRCHSQRLDIARLSVCRTPRHIYAQVIMPNGKVVAAAATVEKEFKGQIKTGNVDAASKIGELIGQRAIKAKITKVALIVLDLNITAVSKRLPKVREKKDLNFKV